MKLHWSVKRGGIIVKTYKEHLLTYIWQNACSEHATARERLTNCDPVTQFHSDGGEEKKKRGQLLFLCEKRVLTQIYDR